MQSAKCSCSRFRGCGRNGKLKNNIQTTGKAIELRLHGIRFLSEHLDLLEYRATISAGKPVSILRVKGEKNLALPSFTGKNTQFPNWELVGFSFDTQQNPNLC